MVLLEQKMVDEVRAKLDRLARIINEMRTMRPGDVSRAIDMQLLLTAQLLNVESGIAASKAGVAQRENRPDEVRRLLGIAQQKKGDAIQKFEEVLVNWGNHQEDYVFLYEKQSIYSLLLPESLLQLGNLKLEVGEWDQAVKYYAKVLRMDRANEARKTALIRMSLAYQQGGRLDEAVSALGTVVKSAPDDLILRNAYASLLFRQQVASDTSDSTTLNALETELTELGKRRNELPQPWSIDVRLIHLGVLRANLTNDTKIIISAMQDATRKFRALEQQSFAPDKEGHVRKYIEDPAFVAEMVGIYSALSERDDFLRLLEVLRAFPDGGEDAYFEARIQDFRRRDDIEGVKATIDEAMASPKISAARKERFATLLQSLAGNMDITANLEKTYNDLKTTFDANPETLKPQAFFVLADMALELGDVERAKTVMERLKAIEGPNGTNWRYINVRIMLTAKDPDYDNMRQIQESIAGMRENWDGAYILRALIEEQYLTANPGDAVALAKLIESYSTATRVGNRKQEVWQRLIELLDSAGRREEAKAAAREAARYGITLNSRGQLPQPYNRMFLQVQKYIEDEQHAEADKLAQECIKLAELRGAPAEFVFSLHLLLGKVFLDSFMYDSARRHLTITAERGGTHIYPLAVCVAKSGDVDGGFTLLLDEIDMVPSAMPTLLPAVLVLLSQVQPSEAIYVRIDKLMERLEKGERLTLSKELAPAEKDHVLPLGTKFIPTRKIRSLVVRFPDKTDNLDPSAIQFFSPEDLVSPQP